jgi:hypothetical protein
MFESDIFATIEMMKTGDIHDGLRIWLLTDVDGHVKEQYGVVTVMFRRW